MFLFKYLMLLTGVESARILAVFPIPSYSHQIVYHQICIALAERGHEVTMLTTDLIKENVPKNLKQIDLSYVYKIWENNYNFTEIVSDKNLVSSISSMVTMIRESTIWELEHPEVQNLINNETEHFDLLIVEYMQPTMLAFKHRFNCNMIGISSMDSPSYGHEAVGNPTHPILYPEIFLPYETSSTLTQRMMSVIYKIFMKTYTDYAFSREDAVVEKYFGKGYPSLLDLSQSLDLLFINVNPILHTIRPLTPATITIGSGLHIKSPKPLPKDIQAFLDNSKHGVIYFSLGSNVKSKDIPIAIRETLMKVFNDLPNYNILWKFEGENLEGKPKNVKIMKWIPQQDVLRHPNVKVFITQGGLQSIEEGIFSNIPFVGMPFFADQMVNARKIETLGIGQTVDRNNITVEGFKATLLQVMHNTKYRNRVIELRKLLRDEPMTGRQKAVWWTEYVLRNKGAQHLKGPARIIPFYYYYYFDIIACLFIGLAVLIAINIMLFKIIAKMFCKSKSTKQKIN